MEKEIIDNIYHLYRSRIVTTIIVAMLAVVAIIVVVGVAKNKIVKSISHQAFLITAVMICSISLIIIQFYSILPIYKDYAEQSYVVLDNAKLVLKTEATGTIDRENQVIVTDSAGKQYEFKMNFDYDLSMGTDYTGTVVYLEHSNYVIWYCFDENTPIVSQ